MDKLKAINQFTNLLALVVLALGAALFILHEREGATALIAGGLTMLKSGAEHAVEK